MCFGSGGGGPQVPAAVPVAPAPIPTETKSGATLEGRQRQVAMLKYGALSTITNKGGSAGITGQGADLSSVYNTSGTSGTQGTQTTGGQ